MDDQLQLELKGYDRFKGAVFISLLVAAAGYLIWFVWASDGSMLLPVGGTGTAAVAVPVLEEKPKVVAPEKPVGPTVSTPELGSQVPMGSQLFAGFAVPGTVVVLYGDGAALGQVETGEDGTWQFEAQLRAPLALRHSVGFYDSDGTLIDEESNLLLDIRGGDDGIAREFAILRPVEGGSLRKGDWVIAGSGKPGSRVKISLDADTLGEVIVDRDGGWVFSGTTPLPALKRELLAREIDGYGDEILSRFVRIRN